MVGMTYGGKVISASSNPTNDLPSLISFFNYFISKWNFPSNNVLSAKDTTSTYAYTTGEEAEKEIEKNKPDPE